MLNDRSDVYSFGILIMEIISGRNPVDYSRAPGEVCSNYLNGLVCRSIFNIASCLVLTFAVDLTAGQSG